MDLKFLFKVCLCVIQLVCVYRLFRYDDCSLVPVQYSELITGEKK